MRLCLRKAANPSLPWDGHSYRVLCPGSLLGFHFQMQGKTNLGCFTQPQIAFFQGWAFALIRWVFEGPDHRDWESVLQSPEQFRNYFSCSHFRSKTKTPSRNKQTHTSMYLFLKEKHSSAPDFLSIFFFFFLFNFRILLIKKCTALLETGVIPKFLLLEYHPFAHLAKPKAFSNPACSFWPWIKLLTSCYFLRVPWFNSHCQPFFPTIIAL